MTEAQIKALQIIKEHQPITPRRFAELMWPNSDGWNRYSKCGPSGVTRGGGMSLAGGGYLGRLARRGLVYWEMTRWLQKNYRLTGRGERLLRELDN